MHRARLGGFARARLPNISDINRKAALTRWRRYREGQAATKLPNPELLPMDSKRRAPALTGPLKFHDFCHLVLATRALIGALVVTRPVRKDADQ